MPTLMMMGVGGGSAPVLGGGGGGLDPATTAWINAVVAAGGSVSGTQQSRVNTLITSLKSHSLFNAGVVRMWLAAGESDLHQAAIDIINLATFTLHGSETLAAGGYTGDGSTGYFDSGTNPSTAGGISQDSLHIGCYNRTNRTTSQNYVMIGGVDAANVFTYTQDGGGNLSYDNNGNSFPSFTTTSVQGFWINSRSSSSALALYKNGSSVATPADTSIGLFNANLYMGGYNSNGSPADFSADQLAAWTIGSGLSATDAANLSSDLNAYMTAWGVNVY